MRAAAAAGRGGVAAGVAGTTLAHGLLLLTLLVLSREREPLGPVYAVRLVAAAPAQPETRRAAPEALPTPPERTAPIEPPQRTARPTPPPPPRSDPTPRRETPAPTRPTTVPNPGETPMGGRDVANVSTPGVEFPFPEYLNHIVNEIYRRWRRPAGQVALRAEIRFLILRDGTVKEIQLTTRSRDFRFDLGAQGAVEAAGTDRAFGPLPEGFPSDVLAISLWFTPRESP